MFRDSTVGYLKSPSSASCTVSFSKTQTASFSHSCLWLPWLAESKHPSSKQVQYQVLHGLTLDLMDWTCNTCAATNPAAQTGTLCSEWWCWWVRGHQLGHTHLETEAGSKSFGLVLGEATDGSGSSQLLFSHPVQLGSLLLSKEGDPTLTPLMSLRIVAPPQSEVDISWNVDRLRWSSFL